MSGINDGFQLSRKSSFSFGFTSLLIVLYLSFVVTNTVSTPPPDEHAKEEAGNGVTEETLTANDDINEDTPPNAQENDVTDKATLSDDSSSLENTNIDLEESLHGEPVNHKTAEGFELNEVISRPKPMFGVLDPHDLLHGRKKIVGDTKKFNPKRFNSERQDLTEDKGNINTNFLGFSFPFASDSILQEWRSLKEKYIQELWKKFTGTAEEMDDRSKDVEVTTPEEASVEVKEKGSDTAASVVESSETDDNNDYRTSTTIHIHDES